MTKKLADSAGRYNVTLEPRQTYTYNKAQPVEFATPRVYVNASSEASYDGKELRPYTGRAGADHSHIKSRGVGC